MFNKYFILILVSQTECTDGLHISMPNLLYPIVMVMAWSTLLWVLLDGLVSTSLLFVVSNLTSIDESNSITHFLNKTSAIYSGKMCDPLGTFTIHIAFYFYCILFPTAFYFYIIS